MTLGNVVAKQGQAARAQTLLADAEDLREVLGDRRLTIKRIARVGLVGGVLRRRRGSRSRN